MSATTEKHASGADSSSGPRGLSILGFTRDPERVPAAGEAHNVSVWRDGNFVSQYVSSELQPAESLLLERYRADLSGHVLELGCGAGRLTGHLIGVGGSVHGIDVSSSMVAYCREHHPSGAFDVADLRDLSAEPAQSLDVVVATNNVLDILEDAERRRVLREIRRILKPGGLLWMSSHNRDFLPNLRSPTDISGRNVVRSAGKLALMPWRMYNRRRLLGLQRFEHDYAIVNDEAHHFRLLHYYISPASQERQLSEEGLDLIACLCSDGREVSARDSVADCVEMHYLARRPASDAT